MYIVAYEHSPVLGRVRIVVDTLGNHLSESRLLGEPLAPEAGDGVPTYLDGPGLIVSDWLRGRNNIRLRTQPGKVN